MDARADGELVHACLTGEEWAWNELVERYARYVYAIATQAFRLAPNDAQRIQRALEVHRATGRPLSALQVSRRSTHV